MGSSSSEGVKEGVCWSGAVSKGAVEGSLIRGGINGGRFWGRTEDEKDAWGFAVPVRPLVL